MRERESDREREIYVLLQDISCNMYMRFLYLIQCTCASTEGLDKLAQTGKHAVSSEQASYGVGTQKNSLYETKEISSFEHPKNMFKLMGKNLITILR